MMTRNGKVLLGVAMFLPTLMSSCNTPTENTERARLTDLPATAEIIFGSTRDTNGRRKELYSMDRNGGHVTRLTFTEEHHRIAGISPSRRYLVVTRTDDDTEVPSGLGDEDRTNLWLLDLEAKSRDAAHGEDQHCRG